MRGEEVHAVTRHDSDERLPLVAIAISRPRAVEVSRSCVTVRMTFDELFEVFADAVEVFDVDELKLLAARISNSKIYKVIQGSK